MTRRKFIFAAFLAAIFVVASATAKRIVVKPGNGPIGNGDVTVTNNDDSNGKAVIRPENPVDSESDVGLANGFKGTVDGVDGSDEIRLGPNNTTTINCNGGGEITLGGNSTVTVTNDNSGGHVTVIQPDGSTKNVDPGETVVFTT